MKDEILKKLSSSEKEIVKILTRAVDESFKIYQRQRNFTYPGANFYPHDISKQEFLDGAKRDPKLKRPNTVVKRDEDKTLYSVPYSEEYKGEISKIAKLMLEAAEICEDQKFSHYLKLRAESIKTGRQEDYLEAAKALFETNEYIINFVLSTDEIYADNFMGIKGAFDACVMIRDEALSKKLQVFVDHVEDYKEALPIANRGLPLSNMAIGAYDTVKFKGLLNEMRCRAWIVPWKADEQMKCGTRQILFKDSIKYQYNATTKPIFEAIFSKDLIASLKDKLYDNYLRKFVFHEISHALGRYDGFRDLKEMENTLDELQTQLVEMNNLFVLKKKGIIDERDVNSYMVTSLTLMFWDIKLAEKVKPRKHYRDGDLVILNFFLDNGIIKVENNYLGLNFERVKPVVSEILGKVLDISSRGDYGASKKLISEYGHTNKLIFFLNRIKNV